MDKIDQLKAEIIRTAGATKDIALQDSLIGLLDQLEETARQSGKDDLILDLWDAREIGEDGLEFAIENNGACDPRKN